MTDMPKAGFLCAGKTPLALACSIRCAYKMMEVLKECGFAIGACHTEITEPFSEHIILRAENTLRHICTCCELVVTVGCDGFSVSDIMPDITDRLCEKKISCFSSALCGTNDILKHNSHISQNNMPEWFNKKILICPSRATSGIFKHSLIMNFPSDHDACIALAKALMPAIGFVVYSISGKSAQNSQQFRNFANSSLEFHEVFNKQYIINL